MTMFLELITCRDKWPVLSGCGLFLDLCHSKRCWFNMKWNMLSYILYIRHAIYVYKNKLC